MSEFSSSIRVSGFVLSSLMFQHLNSDSDVEGFILGDRVAEETNNITDSQIDQVQFEHTINIQKHIPCTTLHSFYNNVGDVSEENIRIILSNQKEDNIIGWYRQRRNARHQMTFLEQVAHRNLMKALSNQELIFLLLTASDVTSSGSTHRLEYSTYISDGSQFHSLPIMVSNLGMFEQQDYWRISTACLALNNCQAIKKCRSNFFSNDELTEVEKVNDMNDKLLNELKKASKNVEQSERLVEQLQADVAILRDAIRKKRQALQTETKESSTFDGSKENILLCTALKTLFPNAPQLRAQVLSTQGFPVFEFCCTTDHDIDISSKLPLVLNHQHPKLRKRGLDKWDRFHGESHSTGLPSSTKKMKTTEGKDGALSDSGSDTEEELACSNVSSSPVF